MKRTLAAVAAATLLSPAFALASTWNVDASHSTAGFAVRHMMISKTRGQFNKVTGKVNLDDKDVTKSTVEASIDVASIDTNEPKRDEHLRSPDFFDVAKFPNMTFKSTKVEKAGAGLKIAGELSMHGVTKPVTFETAVTEPTKNPGGMTVRGVEAKTKISRKDFGLTWNKALETGGVVVGDEVEITLDVELVQEQPAPATKK